MKKTISKESRQLLDEADKLRKRAIDKLQNELFEEVSLLRVELERLAENLRGEIPRAELAEELRKLSSVAEMLLGRVSTRKSKRATKVSTSEKVQWLKSRLANGAQLSKGKLVDEFAKLKGMRNSPTLLDKALKGNPLFEMQEEGRCVMVCLAKGAK